jgi:hypothetical protein
MVMGWRGKSAGAADWDHDRCGAANVAAKPVKAARRVRGKNRFMLVISLEARRRLKRACISTGYSMSASSASLRRHISGREILDSPGVRL